MKFQHVCMAAFAMRMPAAIAGKLPQQHMSSTPNHLVADGDDGTVQKGGSLLQEEPMTADENALVAEAAQADPDSTQPDPIVPLPPGLASTTIPVTTTPATAPLAPSTLTTTTTEGSEREVECKYWICLPGWAPKELHISLKAIASSNSAVNEGCCQKTCDLWHCNATLGFLDNPLYAKNIGESDQICCDRICKEDFDCEPKYKRRGYNARGHSVEECCGATCELFNCTDGWLQNPSNMSEFADGPESCCDPTCSVFNCSATFGWLTNSSALDHKGSSVEECCLAECLMFAGQCISGFAVPAELNETVGSLSTCCVEKCEHYRCKDGWIQNVSKVDEFGSSEEECCLPTCGSYACVGDWANSSDLAKVRSLNLSDESCCEPSCKLHTCGDGWLENETYFVQAGSNDAACCDSSCWRHTCSSGLRKVPDAAYVNRTAGSTDDVCCEPSACSSLDNKTALDEGEGCNDLAEDGCEMRYAILHDEQNGTMVATAVACDWQATGADGAFELCRNTGSPHSHCYATKNLTH